MHRPVTAEKMIKHQQELSVAVWLLTAQNSDDSLPLQQNKKIKIKKITGWFWEQIVSSQWECLFVSSPDSLKCWGKKHWWHSCTAVSIFKDVNIQKCCAALLFFSETKPLLLLFSWSASMSLFVQASSLFCWHDLHYQMDPVTGEWWPGQPEL